MIKLIVEKLRGKFMAKMPLVNQLYSMKFALVLKLTPNSITESRRLN